MQQWHSWDLTISAPSSSATVWRPWEDDETDRMVPEEELFWRPVIVQRFFGGRPLGLGGIVGIYLEEEDIDYLNFFCGVGQYLSRSIQKWLFRDFTYFFRPAPKFWTIFLTNLHFWEIGSNQSKDLLNPYLFRRFSDFKKIPTGPNKSVYKFVDFSCSYPSKSLSVSE